MHMKNNDPKFNKIPPHLAAMAGAQMIGQQPPKPPTLEQIEATGIHTISQIKPRGNLVLLERIVVKETTESKIIKPESAQEPSQYFIVRDIGPGILNGMTGERMPIEGLHIGQKCMSLLNNSVPFNYDGKTLWLVPENQVIGTFEDEEPSLFNKAPEGFDMPAG